VIESVVSFPWLSCLGLSNSLNLLPVSLSGSCFRMQECLGLDCLECVQGFLYIDHKKPCGTTMHLNWDTLASAMYIGSCQTRQECREPESEAYDVLCTEKFSKSVLL
jgi:hypothetical protein